MKRHFVCRLVLSAVALPVALGVSLLACRPAAEAGDTRGGPDTRLPAARTDGEHVDAALSDEVRQAIRANVSGALGVLPDGAPAPRFAFRRAQLDGLDGPEVLVYLLGPPFCGTGGCDLKILRRVDGALEVMQTFPITQTPVSVGSPQSDGSRVLIRSESGGGGAATFVVHRFDGRVFVEASRVTDPPAGLETLFDEGTTYESALML